MPESTNGSTTILEAVNVILESIGEEPVNSIDGGGADASIANRILGEVNREVQSKGWHWNTERETKLVPDNDGNIIIPQNTLKVYSAERCVNVTMRGTRS